METASFTGVLKTIAILFLIYYAVKFLFRLLAPVIVQQVVKKAEQSFHQQQQYNQQQYNTQNNYSQPAQKPQEKKKVGEYIDFEEIE
ncbi:DUF4834 family protein [Flavobacterium sp. MK4S-17]|uniref:DUF4834 family protein n=1 Tax=Flavobacterium sp. MK4S-17 TaxID=2543737 RepID=UPI00135BA0A2|nr:DUF4834 family protein [Flavobacterium sp. MK4S-17]